MALRGRRVDVTRPPHLCYRVKSSATKIRDMARAALMLLAAACIGGDAQIPPCPAGVKDDLNWYTTTSSGKVHDCAWLRLDPDTRCNNDGRFLNCPAACGKCLGVCQNDERDDATWRRKHEAADGPHGCAWAAEEPRNRCFEMGADGRRSGESCEAACGGRSRRTSFRGRRRAHFPRRKATLEDD